MILHLYKKHQQCTYFQIIINPAENFIKNLKVVIFKTQLFPRNAKLLYLCRKITEMKRDYSSLIQKFHGDIFTDKATRLMYATDASIYRVLPEAVAYPKDKYDLQSLISFAKEQKTSLIPRTAGTSLAGQCVGKGIVVDISKYWNQIIEINTDKKWVRAQPGVVLYELNDALKDVGLFFGPETSTANRCMIGGMVANNACGLHSLVYGSTRDHTLEINAILSDGSEVCFKKINPDEYQQKLELQSLEGEIYRTFHAFNADSNLQDEIKNRFPKPDIPRRNTGYALDLLAKENNICKILSGSEGTLAFFTEIKLNLVDLPPKHKSLVCVHLASVEEAMHANLAALDCNPTAIELMDKTILDLTKKNIEQQKNRFFIEGDPGAILMVEFACATELELNKKVDLLQKAMKTNGFGYTYPALKGKEIERAWNLRKAGLGVLSNLPGDAKPVAVIEDTAVDVRDLPSYIKELNDILKKLDISSTYHAHIATGELHIRPILDLHKEEDRKKLYEIAHKTALLVTKYRGTMSGEHGDGRLRACFIEEIYGQKIYQAFKTLKNTFDPYHIFNPGKIIDSPPMNEDLREWDEVKRPQIETFFDYSSYGSFIAALEKCNGSADCRKSSQVGGTMCPSYQATKDEKHSTRGRANLLREFILKSKKVNRFNHQEVYTVLDLCLSCKGCTAECPSNVDMATFKAEFLQQYYKSNRISLRTKLFAYVTQINKLAQPFYRIYNVFMGSKFWGGIIKKMNRIAVERSFPKLHKHTLRKWINKNEVLLCSLPSKQKVVLFIDEFTNYNDVEVGKKAILLLNKLGYNIVIAPIFESGRTFLSKGLVKKAQFIANKNLVALKNKISAETPLLGIEPSAILSFRDEYPKLADKENASFAKKITEQTFTIEEFIENEMKAGRIPKDLFKKDIKKIKLHGHCHQKALGDVKSSVFVLSYPENYEVAEISSGCCGMAGSFGYEKEHYEVSMKIGELVLFPSVRASGVEVLIAAPGTSCRQQILDGAARTAYHPIEILYDAML